MAEGNAAASMLSITLLGIVAMTGGAIALLSVIPVAFIRGGIKCPDKWGDRSWYYNCCIIHIIIYSTEFNSQRNAWVSGILG